MSDRQWRKHLQHCKALYDCQRKLHTDDVTKRLSTCKRDPTPEGRMVIPFFVIEGPWGLVADNRAA